MRRHRFLFGVAALTFLATFTAAGCQNESTPAVVNGVVVPALAAQATALVNTAPVDQGSGSSDLAQATLGSGQADAQADAHEGGAECLTPEGAPFVAESC